MQKIHNPFCNEWQTIFKPHRQKTWVRERPTLAIRALQYFVASLIQDPFLIFVFHSLFTPMNQIRFYFFVVLGGATLLTENGFLFFLTRNRCLSLNSQRTKLTEGFNLLENAIHYWGALFTRLFWPPGRTGRPIRTRYLTSVVDFQTARVVFPAFSHIFSQWGKESWKEGERAWRTSSLQEGHTAVCSKRRMFVRIAINETMTYCSPAY